MSRDDDRGGGDGVEVRDEGGLVGEAHDAGLRGGEEARGEGGDKLGGGGDWVGRA